MQLIYCDKSFLWFTWNFFLLICWEYLKFSNHVRGSDSQGSIVSGYHISTFFFPILILNSAVLLTVFLFYEFSWNSNDFAAYCHSFCSFLLSYWTAHFLLVHILLQVLIKKTFWIDFIWCLCLLIIECLQSRNIFYPICLHSWNEQPL